MAYPQILGTPATTSYTSTGTSFTIAMPSGIQAGEMLVLVSSMTTNHNLLQGGVSAWSGALDVSVDSGNNVYQRVRWKIATGSEGASEAFTASASTKGHFHVFRVGPVSIIQPLGDFEIAPAAGGSATVTIPGVDTLAEDTLIVVTMMSNGTDGFRLPVSTGLTFTEVYDVSGDSRSSAMAWANRNAAGTTPNIVLQQQTGSNRKAGFALAIRPYVPPTEQEITGAGDIASAEAFGVPTVYAGVQHRGSVSYTSGGSSSDSFNVSMPSLTQLGDLLLMAVTTGISGMLTPAGWTKIFDEAPDPTGSGENRHLIFMKIAQVADVGGGQHTLSAVESGNTQRWVVTISAFYGHNPYEPIDMAMLNDWTVLYGSATTTHPLYGAIKGQPNQKPVGFFSTWISNNPANGIAAPYPAGWQILAEGENTSTNFFYQAAVTRNQIGDNEADLNQTNWTFERAGTNYSSVLVLVNAFAPASTKEVTGAGNIPSAESFGIPDLRGRVIRVGQVVNSSGSTRSTSYFAAFPTGIQVGDLLILSVWTDQNVTGGAKNAPPSGWQEIHYSDDAASSGALKYYEYMRIVDGNEPINIPFTGINQLWVSATVAFRGHYPGAPFVDVDRTKVSNVSGTTVGFPAVQGVGEGDGILAIANLYAAVSSWTTVDAMTGFTTIASNQATANTRYLFMKGMWKSDATALDTGPFSTTSQTAFTHAINQIRVIRAKPNPTPPPTEVTGAGNIESAEHFPSPAIWHAPVLFFSSNYASPAPAGATSFTPIIPTLPGEAPAVGDMMLIAMGVNSNQPHNTIQMPEGWVRLGSSGRTQAGVSNGLVYYYRRFTGTEDTSPTWIWDGNARSYAAVFMIIKGVDTADPWGGGSGGFVYEDDSVQTSLVMGDPDIYEPFSLKLNAIAALRSGTPSPDLTRASDEAVIAHIKTNMLHYRTTLVTRERMTVVGVEDQAPTTSSHNTAHISGTVVVKGPNFFGLSIHSAGDIASAEAFGNPSVTAYVGPPARRSVSNNKLAAAGNLITVNKPAGTMQGDFMLCAIQVEHNVNSQGATTIVTPPAGWTVALDIDGWSARIIVYQKWAGALEASNYTFSFERSPTPANQYAQIWMASFMRVSTIRPIGRTDFQGRDAISDDYLSSFPIEAFPLWTPDSQHIVVLDLYSINGSGGAIGDALPEAGFEEFSETVTTVSTVNRTFHASMKLQRAPLLNPGIRTWNVDQGVHAFVSGQLSLLPTYGWVDDAGNIPTGEAFGTPDLGFISPPSIPSAEAFGNPSVGIGISPSEILSEEGFDMPQLVNYLVGATLEVTAVGNIPSAELFEEPRVEYLTNRSDPALYGLPQGAQEIVEERTKTSKTFLTPNGSLVRVISQQLHYPSPLLSGDFLDLDFSFRNIGGNMYLMDQHDFEVRVYVGALDPYIQTYDRIADQGIRVKLPSVPYSVSGNTVRFMWGGMDCKYQVRKRGVKFATTVSNRTGGSAFSFVYELLGGAPDPVIDADGNLVSSFFTIPRAFAQTANGKKLFGTPWELVVTPERIIPPPPPPAQPEGFTGPSTETYVQPPPTIIPGKKEFRFSIADNAWENEAFPYIIDPTLDLEVTADSRDDGIMREGGSYAPSGAYTRLQGQTVVQAQRTKGTSGSDTSYFWTTNGLMSFDTRLIPDDAIIIGARFRGRVVTAQSIDNTSMVMDWFNWTGANTDWTNSALATAMAAQPIRNFVAGQDVNLPMIGVTPTVINRAGDTKVRMSVTGSTPTGVNRIEFASAEDPILPPPMLLVEYEEAAAFRSSSQLGTTSPVGQITVPKPEGTQEHDLLLCAVFAYPQANTTRVDITPPAGWALFPGTGSSLDYPSWGRIKLFYRFTDVSDLSATGYTFTFNQSAVAVASCLSYYGVQDLETNVVTYSNTNSGSSIPSPAKTTTGVKDRVVRFAGGHNASMGGTWTPPPGTEERSDVQNSGTGVVGLSMEAVDEVQAAAGTSIAKNHTVTLSRARRWAMTVALNPSMYIYPVTPIYSEEVFGHPVLEAQPVNIFPQPIPSAESFPVPHVSHNLRPIPIASEEAFGVPRLYPGVSPFSIISAENFPTPTITPQPTYRDIESIPSAEAFGVPHIRHMLGQFSIASAEGFGVPSVTLVLPPTDVLVARAKQESLVISGERGELWYEPKLWISNIWGDELRELPGVISASVDLSNYRDHTWSLALTCEMTDAFDPLTDFVLVTLDVATERDPWRRYPLGLYRFDLPKGRDEPENSFWELTGYSVEWLLTRKTAIGGFTVKRNGSLFAAIRKILDDNGIPRSRLTMPPDVQDKAFKKGVKFDPLKDQDGALYIRIANQLLSMAGMGALQTTARGQFFFNPIVPFENKHATVRYGPREHGGEDMILYEAISRDVDYSRFANEVFVYNANVTSGLEDTAKPIKAVARNMSEDSPVSIPNLGYTVTKTITQDDITDQDAANKLARAELARSTAYHLKRTIHTIPDPRRGPDEAYRLEAYSTLDIPILEGKWQSVSWKLPLSTNPAEMIMEHQVSRNEDF